MPTVLIAPPAYLGSLRERGEFKDALAFADTDALRAFDAIARRRATVVVLESTFAGTSRGTALINRIKADPLLVECDVRVLDYDGARAANVASAPPADTPEGRSLAMPHSENENVGPGVKAADLLDHAAVRDAEQTTTTIATASEIAAGVELLIDGTAATLVELSTTGAQVVSTASLKPHQRVRLSLTGATAMTVNGVITWAMFEMPASGPCYRADVRFLNPDSSRIVSFIEANRR